MCLFCLLMVVMFNMLIKYMFDNHLCRRMLNFYYRHFTSETNVFFNKMNNLSISHLSWKLLFCGFYFAVFLRGLLILKGDMLLKLIRSDEADRWIHVSAFAKNPGIRSNSSACATLAHQSKTLKVLKLKRDYCLFRMKPIFYWI